MRTTACQPRENRTITVDFQDETTYFQLLLSDGKAFVECVLAVPVQVVKTSLTLQIAPSERLQEAETVQRHPAGPLRTPL